jgi:hypothetical protein
METAPVSCLLSGAARVFLHPTESEPSTPSCGPMGGSAMDEACRPLFKITFYISKMEYIGLPRKPILFKYSY